jgi:F-type H+-transporting ATPase subunit b
MFSILAQVAGPTTTIPTVNYQSKNPILPAGNELVWGTFSFVILFALLAIFFLPAVKKGMTARTEKIKADLGAAEESRTAAQTVLDDYQRQLADAKNEANRIIEEARQTADALRKDLMAKADADAQEVRTRATADIEAAKDRAMAELRTQLTTLTIELAERVVKRNLDRDSNAALVDDYISSIGRS